MCGPTVYDSAHIGHASSCVRFDIIRRILGSVFDIDSMLVMGITDIDDKIIKRMKEVSNVRGL
jgi:cysteinyl-tRNA synthetase